MLAKINQIYRRRLAFAKHTNDAKARTRKQTKEEEEKDEEEDEAKKKKEKKTKTTKRMVVSNRGDAN